jgi:hypothetical protein
MSRENLQWSDEERDRGIEGHGEGIALYQSGDMDTPPDADGNTGNGGIIDAIKARFGARHNRPTTLTNDQIVCLQMSADDWADNDWFDDRMVSAEQYFAGEGKDITFSPSYDEAMKDAA